MHSKVLKVIRVPKKVLYLFQLESFISDLVYGFLTELSRSHLSFYERKFAARSREKDKLSTGLFIAARDSLALENGYR